MNLFYESGYSGKKIDFMCDSVFAQNPEEILVSEWKYETTSTYANSAQLKETYRECSEFSMTVDVYADDSEEFNEIMKEISSAMDADSANMIPGKLYWNDCYRSCICVKREFTEYTEFADCVTVTFIFLALNPSWIEEISVRVNPATSGTALTIPFTIPATITVSSRKNYINAEHYSESDFRLIAYGPASTFKVEIGGNTYEVDHQIASGEYLVIDSRESAQADKRCYIVQSDGSTLNVFNDRSSEHSIFQKISGGLNEISYTQTFGIDLTVFVERGDPRWI